MDTTPKLNKRSSLSLQNCRIKKDSCASPQNSNRAKKTFSNVDKLPCSPVMTSRSWSTECFTPTQKIISLDDTLDSSQKALDTSFSPNSLFSQTLPTESPEVGWRWARQKSDFTESGVVDGDNGFANADSPCAPNKSSKKRKLISNRREQYRKAIEFDIHRAEKSRAKQVLQKRYAKLKEQLKEAKLTKTLDVDSSTKIAHRNSPDLMCYDSTMEMPTEMSIEFPTETSLEIPKGTSLEMPTEIPTNVLKVMPIDSAAITSLNDSISGKAVNTSLSDFFNDSDSDGFLLEATQQIESKIHLTVPVMASVCEGNTYNCTETKATTSEANNSTTSNEKNSSLYMKFLEDDSPDDWFTSLDDVIEQAMEAKKPRNSLQRYKSLPTESTSLTSAQNTSKHVENSKISHASGQDSNFGISRHLSNKNNITTTTDMTKFKRYASSNTIPSSSR